MVGEEETKRSRNKTKPNNSKQRKSGMTGGERVNSGARGEMCEREMCERRDVREGDVREERCARGEMCENIITKTPSCLSIDLNVLDANF